MANPVSTHTYLLLLSTFLHSVHPSHQIQPSQFNALREIQQFLNYPSLISIFNNTWDFCNLEPSPLFTVICYEDNVTQLHITANNGDFPPSLPQNFSIDALFSSISSLQNLKVLSLVSIGLWGPLPATIGKLSSMEILNLSSNYINGFIPLELSYLKNLETLVLDHNEFTGQIPSWISSFNDLAVLGLRNNSLFGPLPISVSRLENLRVLAMADNHLYGEVPNLQNLTNLQVLDLKNNKFGPDFPVLNPNVVTVELRNNSFQSSVPYEALTSYLQLQKLDISINTFIGPFSSSLFALPSIEYIDISDNKLTGKLLHNTTCNEHLVFVNLSSNLLTGDLPECLQQQNNSEKRVVSYGGNCFSKEEQDQHPSNFCHNEALAVKVMPQKLEHEEGKAMGVVGSSLVTGIGGLTVIVGLSYWVFHRRKKGAAMKGASTRLIIEKLSTVNTVKLLSDARYISETMKMGANLPTYRAFALEELREATDNFTHSTIIGEGSLSQIYRGKLADGTAIAVRCLKMRRKHSPPTLTQHIETISKLRHKHLASCIGHCFECCPDDSSVGIIYLVFEYLSNGTLRSSISGVAGQRLNWAQRIAGAIGIAKGIQFLHTGMIPGVFSNNLKITDVLLDPNFHVKICGYNLPLLAENGGMGGSIGLKPNVRVRANEEEKDDIHDFGVILLEILVGRPIISQNDVMVVKDILQVSNKMDDTARRSIVDPTIIKECSPESLKTVMEICLRCLSNEWTDRPSIDDVLWTLQFAAQLQDPWRLDSHHVHQQSVSLPL
ncbi:probable inactive leucine-rich repeat receptor-like protein kinase At3g03770 [Hibiscus syriacus]|uniref:probable inactive leucine-rich repeat receptor-like protein kinase At3g03770 n=1 Tax=Hibiscus syriacus TaxID=106335 RepID=UPI001922643E|nr:probable inactive leucine-rich repeat receptor-like protein kinase At3g03770 [Hibiscus syriacus]